VRALATNPKLFTYIRDSKANVQIVMGDGRLELAKAPNGSYGLIVLDAFSSDSIPVHMLTREAAQMYLSKLAPGGFIAYHISNHYLDLSGVLSSIAGELGLVAYIDEDGPTPEETTAGKLASIWMVLARKKEDLDPLLKTHDWSEEDLITKEKTWTDDFSNVLGVLKRDD
jgi:spermidine synthase